MTDAAKAPINWIASYPRSGNTWVRVLLHTYFFGPATDTRDVARTVPDIHAPQHTHGEPPEGGPSVRLFKTHLVWSDKHPGAERTSKVVYLVRHPADVLMSCLNFHRVMGTQAAAKGGGAASAKIDDAAYVRTFLRVGGDQAWLGNNYGTLEENIASWLDACPHEKLVVRYEDLRADTPTGLTRIIGFLGEELVESRVERAVAASGFDQMRALEIREKRGRREKHPFFGGSDATLRKGVYFMAKGRVGEKLDRIQPGFDAQLRRRFASIMERFGYE